LDSESATTPANSFALVAFEQNETTVESCEHGKELESMKVAYAELCQLYLNAMKTIRQKDGKLQELQQEVNNLKSGPDDDQVMKYTYLLLHIILCVIL